MWYSAGTIQINGISEAITIHKSATMSCNDIRYHRKLPFPKLGMFHYGVKDGLETVPKLHHVALF